MLIGEKGYQALVEELCKEDKVKLGVQLLDLCPHCLCKQIVIILEILEIIER